MWKFIVDVVHDFVSSLQPDVGRGFLHVSNVFLFELISIFLASKDHFYNWSECTKMFQMGLFASQFSWGYPSANCFQFFSSQSTPIPAVGDEKWSHSETGNVIDGHNTAGFVYFLRQSAITTHETRTQARI